MSISKIIGSIEESRGPDSVRIRVVSFKRNNEEVISFEEIRKQFPPHGYVFGLHFLNKFSFDFHSLIEFHVVPISYEKENADEFLLDVNKDCKVAGFPIFFISQNILANELSIDQPLLKTYLQVDYPHFYIQHEDYLYGPFKSNHEEIVPKTGTEVFRYEMHEVTISHSGDNSYLVKLPAKNLATIDCMTLSQIGDWFKAHLRASKGNFDFSVLKRAIETQHLDSLNKSRLERIFNCLDSISLTLSDLRDLSKISQELSNQYSAALEHANSELRNELIEPIIQENFHFDQHLKVLTRSVEKANREKNNLSKGIEILKSEFSQIQKEKNRIIEDIKLQTLIESELKPERANISYSDEIIERDCIEYDSLSEFINVLNETLKLVNGWNDVYSKSIIYQFKDRRCFLSNSVELIVTIARITNNCRLFIQQIEPDWIKFEFLYNSGFKHAWEEAHSNPNRLHFLILEDINMAVADCYFRPVLDMLSGVRQKLPGLNTSWPPNLWIFGIPVSINAKAALGLPMIKNTYSNWGAFPTISFAIADMVYTDRIKSLQLSQLLDHDMIISQSIDGYFDS